MPRHNDKTTMTPSDFREFANNLRVLAKVFDGTAKSIEEMNLDAIEPTNLKSGRLGIKGLSAFSHGVAKSLTDSLYGLLPETSKVEDVMDDINKKKQAAKKASKRQQAKEKQRFPNRSTV